VPIQSTQEKPCYRTSTDTGDCLWDISATFVVGQWKSAIYGIYCANLSGTVDFIVAPSPDSGTKTLFITEAYTSLIYNPWGGRSGYGYFSNIGSYFVDEKSQRISRNRPALSPATFGANNVSMIGYLNDPFFRNSTVFSHRRPILSWVNDYPAIDEWGTISDDSIARLGPDYLLNFSMIIFLGKYEYTTVDMWTAILQYVQNGGKTFIKSYENLLNVLTTDGTNVHLSMDMCMWWSNKCKGFEVLRNQSGFDWDLDVFGMNYRYELVSSGYLVTSNSVLDANNWVAKRLGLIKDGELTWKVMDSKYNPHARVKQVGDKFCFADGNIDCANVTMIAISQPLRARDPLGLAKNETDGDTLIVRGVLANIRHGNGEMIVLSQEFYGGDKNGIPVVLSLLNEEEFINNN